MLVLATVLFTVPSSMRLLMSLKLLTITSFRPSAEKKPEHWFNGSKTYGVNLKEELFVLKFSVKD